MSISGVNANSISNYYQYYSSESESANSVESIIDYLSDSDSDSTSTDAADSILFSSQSQIYCKLQQLQESDPEEFKKICLEIADKLTASAQKVGGSGSTELAAKFYAAAESGSMDDLVSTTTDTTDTSSTTSSITDYLAKYYSQLNSSDSDDSSSDLILEILSKYGVSI